jgi:hypothetical protein
VNKNESWDGEMGGRHPPSPPGDSAMNSWINSHRRRGGKTGTCKYLSRSFLHKKIPHIWGNRKIQYRVKNPVRKMLDCLVGGSRSSHRNDFASVPFYICLNFVTMYYVEISRYQDKKIGA